MAIITSKAPQSCAIELLWENAALEDSTLTANGGTIVIDKSFYDYDLLYVVWVRISSTTTDTFYSLLPVTTNTTDELQLFAVNGSSSNQGVYARSFSITDENTLTSKGSRRQTTSNAANAAIPYQIYGIKGVYK